MTAKERIEAINAIVEFMATCGNIISKEDYEACISKVVNLIKSI